MVIVEFKMATVLSITPWIMNLEVQMLHSQRLSSNPYPEVNQFNLSYL